MSVKEFKKDVKNKIRPSERKNNKELSDSELLTILKDRLEKRADELESEVEDLQGELNDLQETIEALESVNLS